MSTAYWATTDLLSTSVARFVHLTSEGPCEIDKTPEKIEATRISARQGGRPADPPARVARLSPSPWCCCGTPPRAIPYRCGSAIRSRGGSARIVHAARCASHPRRVRAALLLGGATLAVWGNPQPGRQYAEPICD